MWCTWSRAGLYERPHSHCLSSPAEHVRDMEGTSHNGRKPHSRLGQYMVDGGLDPHVRLSSREAHDVRRTSSQASGGTVWDV